MGSIAKAAIARGKEESKKTMIAAFGRMKWWLMGPGEKHNYGIMWALGYLTAKDEQRPEAPAKETK